jgi:hypothetical protein
MSILQRMRVNYLLVDPARLSPRIHARLGKESGLELLDRESDTRGLQVREIYRVRSDVQEYPHPVPPDVRVVSADVPSLVRPKRFYEIPFVLRVGSRSFDGHIEVGYRMLFGDLLMNAGDEVRHVVKMERSGVGQWVGKLFFVGPYEAGEYAIELYAVDAGGQQVLQRPSGQRARYHIEVR